MNFLKKMGCGDNDAAESDCSMYLMLDENDELFVAKTVILYNVVKPVGVPVFDTHVRGDHANLVATTENEHDVYWSVHDALVAMKDIPVDQYRCHFTSDTACYNTFTAWAIVCGGYIITFWSEDLAYSSWMFPASRYDDALQRVRSAIAKVADVIAPKVDVEKLDREYTASVTNHVIVDSASVTNQRRARPANHQPLTVL